MKNNKGFTIVEILAVITIIALIMLIAVPSVTNVIYKGKVRAYNTIISSVEAAAAAYALEMQYNSNSKLVYDENKQATITLKFMIDNKLIKGPFEDPINKVNIPLDSTIIITKIEKRFEANFTYGDIIE